MKAKKGLALLLSVISMLSLCACGQSGESDTPATPSTLVKTTTLNYNAVDCAYNNVILYQDGSKIGVLNNDGSVRIEAQYDDLDALSENYLAYRTGNESGIININNEKVFTGNQDIDYLGGDHVLLTTTTPCDKSDPKAVPGGSDFIKYSYQLYSLKDRAIVETADFSNMTWIRQFSNADRGSEHNVFIGDYANRALTYYVYFSEKGELVQIENEYDYLDNGNVIINNILYDPKGNVLIDPKDLGYTGITAENDLCPCGELYKLSSDNGYALIDENANILAQSQDSTLCYKLEHEDEYIIMHQSSGVGVIDKTGKEIVPFVYSQIKPYTSNTVAVQKNGCWGIIDATNGNILVEPTVEGKYNSSNHCFEIDGEYCCLINPDNGEVTVYDQLNLVGYETLGVYSAYDADTGRAVITPTRALTDFIYGSHGQDILCTKDGSLFLAARGNIVDVYVWG